MPLAVVQGDMHWVGWAGRGVVEGEGEEGG